MEYQYNVERDIQRSKRELTVVVPFLSTSWTIDKLLSEDNFLIIGQIIGCYCGGFG